MSSTKTRYRKAATAGRAFAEMACSSAGWPHIFNRKHPKPLALKFRDQLRQAVPDAPCSAIYAFLKMWCDRFEYHKAIATGEARHNLDGTVDSDVTPEEQAYAALRMQQQDAGRKEATP